MTPQTQHHSPARQAPVFVFRPSQSPCRPASMSVLAARRPQGLVHEVQVVTWAGKAKSCRPRDTYAQHHLNSRPPKRQLRWYTLACFPPCQPRYVNVLRHRRKPWIAFWEYSDIEERPVGHAHTFWSIAPLPPQLTNLELFIFCIARLAT